MRYLSLIAAAALLLGGTTVVLAETPILQHARERSA